MRKFGLLSLLAFGAMFGAVLTGCGDEETTEPVVEKTNVKFYHVAPGVQGVDVQFDGTGFALNRMFGDFTPYLSADAGSTEVKLLNAGTATALATETFTFEKDKNYSLFAVADNAGAADLVLFTDDLTPPEAGKAHIRVAHMIPDGPVIKVAIMQKGPFAQHVAFKDNTQSFVDVDAGAVTLRVQDDTATGGSGQNEPLVQKSVLLEAGKIYTLVAQGNLGDETAELVLIPH